MWTEKHKPATLEDVAGQGKAVSEVRSWVGSRKRGQAMLLAGPPGCGKTLMVEALAKESGATLIQLNASDKRSTQDIEEFAQTATTMPLFGGSKIILIDEADGLSGKQDRGAASAIIKLIKASNYPIFLTANDPWSPKLKSLKPYIKTIKVHKVPAPSVAKRLRDICVAEGIAPDEDALKHLARWSQGDMRSAVNDLQIAAQGKNAFTSDELQVLGFRERESTVFDVLPTIFRSGSMSASRKAIHMADKDSDELFWWMESNMHLEFKDPAELADAFETLAKADVFRGLVMNQQNWRFKGFMVDMMAGVSLSRKDSKTHGFIQYQPPKKFIQMARAKGRNAMIASAHSKLGGMLHCSKKSLLRDYAPYLKLIERKRKGFLESMGLDKDEIKAL